MAIIPSIGRKSLRLRVLILSVYAILILGSMTTVYPFAIMLATSLTSHTDYEQYRLIPMYLRDDKVLTAKYLEEKNRGAMFDLAKLRYHIEEPVATSEGGMKKYGRFIEMRDLYETYDLSSPLLQARVDDWMAFKKSLPLKYCDTYFHARIFAIGETQAAFQKYLKAKYPTPEILRTSLDEMPKQYVIVTPPFDAYDKHSWYPARDPKSLDWEAFRATLPARALNVMTVRPLYQKFLLDKYPKIEDLNAAWDAQYRYFWQVPFPTAAPADKSAADWTTFVRLKMPMRYARLDVAACRQAFAEFIREKYGTIEKYNGLTGQSVASFEALEPPAEMPQSSLLLADWQEFYEKRADLSHIVLDTADQLYARYIEEKYKDVAALNAAYGTEFGSFESIEPPYREEDYRDLATRKSDIKWNYITRNYALVLERVFLQGRPIFNTTLLVLLTVASAVTINPLAAYALSRYRLSYTAKILVFMLATMAFPAEVAMIPNFLMIKSLGLLNTFGALILPGLASGYFIFLLKGFFDSLPAELYEAASIDGASELRMFYTITLPLSLPVLSVIALFAFGGAYGSFLWSFTTCQDPKMWTLMVFLQQFQIEAASCPYIIMASLVLAAIPTMIVFLSAQKVLMKGIVIPTMK